MRVLDKSDRSKGANEICLEYSGNTLYDLFKLKNEEIKLDNNIELKFCQNIYRNKSSCIYIRDNKVIRLAGDIAGEKNNKNKKELVHSDNKSQRKIKVYLTP